MVQNLYINIGVHILICPQIQDIYFETFRGFPIVNFLTPLATYFPLLSLLSKLALQITSITSLVEVDAIASFLQSCPRLTTLNIPYAFAVSILSFQSLYQHQLTTMVLFSNLPLEERGILLDLPRPISYISESLVTLNIRHIDDYFDDDALCTLGQL
jgi:hypothetical protein